MAEETAVIENPVLRGAEAVLDRIAPLNEKQKAERVADPPPVTEKPVTEKPVVTETKPVTEPEKPLPSFLVETPATVKKEEVKPTVTEDDWPEKLPDIPDNDKRQVNYRKWRQEYHERGTKVSHLEAELAKTKDQIGKPDEALQTKLKQLEEERNGLAARPGVESHPEFQRLTGQRTAAVQAAKTLLKENEGDPDRLDKMLSQRGKSYWDAYQELADGLPEMARRRLDRIVGDIETFDQRRDYALSKAPETMAELRKRDVAAQKKALETERGKMESTLNELVTEMRDTHKLEVLQKTNNPKEQWWNDQADQIVKTARDVLLNNGDMRKLEAAVLLGCSADVYRKLFLETNARAIKAEKQLAEIERAHPTIESESSSSSVVASGEVDPKMPISKLAIDLLHKARSGSGI